MLTIRLIKLADVRPSQRARRTLATLVIATFFAASLQAQTVAPATPATSTTPWSVMNDGVLFLTSDNQGGPRGGNEVVSQNWWMTMAARPVRSGLLTLTGMFSLEPATTPAGGYQEVFQGGETYRGAPIVDHQHPHDFLMQLSAVYRLPVNERTTLRFTGAPVGEASVGPPAFMHRRSASENPIAPLTHHSFDSTHVAMGVFGAGVDVGPLSADATLFNGREPDEQRWDLMDPGPLDSWATRLLLRPRHGFELQGSFAYLTHPEVLELQNVKRATTSLSYTHEGRGENYTSIMLAAARNYRLYSSSDALLAEFSHRTNRMTIFSRYEGLEVETEHLLFPGLVHKPHLGELIDPLHAVTMGAAYELTRIRGWELGLGGDVVLYQVPLRLQTTHGVHPASSHLFLRLRAPLSSMGRMWDMRMSDGMRH